MNNNLFNFILFDEITDDEDEYDNDDFDFDEDEDDDLDIDEDDNDYMVENGDTEFDEKLAALIERRKQIERDYKRMMAEHERNIAESENA